MVVKCTVVGAWVEGAVRNWFEEEEGGDGKRSEKCLIDFNYQILRLEEGRGWQEVRKQETFA